MESVTGDVFLMGENSWTSTTRQGSDYDGVWKEALRGHLKQFIDHCFPELFSQIDWTSEPEWLDKEIGQIIGQAGQRSQEVDLLFKVRLINGCDQWILCHIEVQSSYDPQFEPRVEYYNSGLKWHFRREVLTFLILADLDPNWHPSRYHFEMAGYRSDRQFPLCKVLNRLESDWRGKNSLVVEVSRAQIAALRTARDPELRFNAKTELVRNLYTSGYNREQIREIFRLIDWMMHLRPDWERRFKSELIAYEEKLQMPYITSVERLAKEEGREAGREEGLEEGRQEGREQGREQGSVTLLLRMLTRLFGHLPDEIVNQIQQLRLDSSQRLGEALFDFRSLDDLSQWLRDNN